MRNPPGPRTFEDILHQTQVPVRAYIAGLGISPGDVDELAIETYRQLSQSLERIPADVPPEVWVKGIAKNVCLDHLRKNARRGRLHRHALAEVLANTTTSLERLTSRPSLPDVLGDCLAKLPPERREMLKQRYVREVSSESIAEKTSTSTDAVRTAFHRIRAGLRDALAQKLARPS